MADKSLAVSVVIGAALASSFGKVVKTTNERTAELAKAFAVTDKKKRALSDFRALHNSLGKTGSDMSRARAKTAALGRAVADARRTLSETAQALGENSVSYKKAASSLKVLQREFRHARSVSDSLRQSHRQQRNELRRMRDELQQAGFDTRHLADEQRRLDKVMDHLRSRESRYHNLQLAEDRFKGLKERAIGAAGSTYSFARIAMHNAEFEHAVTMMANSGGLNDRQKSGLRSQLAAESSLTNQYKDELLGGVDFLVGKGLQANKAVKAIHQIGMAATATGASIEDLSATSFAMMANMGITQQQLAASLDIVASAGEQGGFELRNMARYFPSLTAQAQALGMHGKEGVASIGAALQIAMKGAGTEGEAANNLQNFLAKITSKDVVSNLKKHNVSVQDVFEQAKINGKNPLVEIIRKINDVTSGDPFILNEIFGDMQVKNFLNPMMANMAEFDNIYRKSMAANGLIAHHFSVVMGDTTEKLKNVKRESINMGDAFASSLKPEIDAALDIFGALAAAGTRLVSNFPVVGKVVGGLTAGFVALTGAAAAFTAVQWVMNTSLVAGTISFARQGLAVVASRTAMIGAAAATGIMASAQWALNAAMMANPIGLIIAGVATLAASAYVLYSKWDSVMAWFGNKIKWITDSFSLIGEMWQTVTGSGAINTAVPLNIDKNTVSAMNISTPNIHQDNRATYHVTVNAHGGDPAQVRDAVQQALADHQQQQAATLRGALFDLS